MMANCLLNSMRKAMVRSCTFSLAISQPTSYNKIGVFVLFCEFEICRQCLKLNYGSMEAMKIKNEINVFYMFTHVRTEVRKKA